MGGRAETSRSEYGCSLHAQRDDSVCKNGLRIQRQQLEGRLLAGLQERVLREEFIDYVQRMSAELFGGESMDVVATAQPRRRIFKNNRIYGIFYSAERILAILSALGDAL